MRLWCAQHQPTSHQALQLPPDFSIILLTPHSAIAKTSESQIIEIACVELALSLAVPKLWVVPSSVPNDGNSDSFHKVDSHILHSTT